MNSNKKNIMLVVAALQLGGQERAAVNTVDLMVNDYNITFVVFDSTEAVYAPACPVIDLNIPASHGNMRKVINALRRAQALRKIKREQEIDLTMSFGTTANLVNVLSGHIGKVFISLRGYESIRNHFIDRIIYYKSDKIICICKGLCAALTKMAPLCSLKTEYLYNPHDISKALEYGKEAVGDYDFSIPTIVTHGRLHRIKHYSRLIKAFYLAHSKVPDSQLLIIGEGPERSALEELIEHYNLHDSVTLLGFRKNPFAYLSKSTLYVLSSYTEGFSFSLVEGMTFLPAVSIDCKAGPRELLSEGAFDRVCEGVEEAEYGILVRTAYCKEFSIEITDDDSILADAILSVLSDPAKLSKYKEQGNKRARFFSMEKYKNKLGGLFEAAL